MKKEVKNQVEEVKKDFELDIITLLKKGLNPSKIAVHLNMSLPNLSYYLSSLKKQNVIKKIGYGVWEVIPSGEVKILSHKGSLQVKEVRGHAFIWKIKPNKKFDWIELLNSKKISYELKGVSKTPRIIINNKKVWLGENYITIFEPKWNSFFAINPIESKKQAVFDMIDTIQALKEIFGDFKYNFTCRRQHYGFINNKEAMHFIRKEQKILIRNEKGYWFSIDFSQNRYQEAETIHERDADIDGIGYQRLMNSHERTGFKVTPEFTLEVMNGIQKNQIKHEESMVYLDRNLKTHFEVLDKIGNKVGELGSVVQDLANEVKKLREERKQ